MKEHNRTRKLAGSVLIVFGVAMLIGAAALFLHNRINDKLAGDVSNEILDILSDSITEDGKKLVKAPKALAFEGKEMETLEFDSERYVGFISIPSIEVNLPVNAVCDEQRLSDSACLYTGSCWTDDMVICAHNYSKHFGHLLRIDPGSEVLFTSVDGIVFRYTVSYTETVSPYDPDYIVKNKNNSSDEGVISDWDLTLFTCRLDGQTRYAARCVRID